MSVEEFKKTYLDKAQKIQGEVAASQRTFTDNLAGKMYGAALSHVGKDGNGFDDMSSLDKKDVQEKLGGTYAKLGEDTLAAVFDAKPWSQASEVTRELFARGGPGFRGRDLRGLANQGSRITLEGVLGALRGAHESASTAYQNAPQAAFEGFSNDQLPVAPNGKPFGSPQDVAQYAQAREIVDKYSG
ncbi:hypothetical protein D6789_03525 [Candidatus Woesearchaeota archaeon]|nr:MAG: hypothetical protein D6789_03525 [Candidatus Woesearchaeota archaeon]